MNFNFIFSKFDIEGVSQSTDICEFESNCFVPTYVPIYVLTYIPNYLPIVVN